MKEKPAAEEAQNAGVSPLFLARCAQAGFGPFDALVALFSSSLGQVLAGGVIIFIKIVRVAKRAVKLFRGRMKLVGRITVAFQDRKNIPGTGPGSF
jgi:hypothetical protein